MIAIAARIVTPALLIVGCATGAAGPAGNAPSQSAGMARALLVAAKEVSSADSAITCQASPPPAQGFGCIQSLPQRRYATLGVTVTAAHTPMRSGALVLEDTLVGPGGGSTRYRGQTEDHRYDIVATQAEQLGPEDRSHLSPAPRLIARIIALYAARPETR